MWSEELFFQYAAFNMGLNIIEKFKWHGIDMRKIIYFLKFFNYLELFSS